MIYLILGDIHGNIISLEKLLEIEKGNYDSIICHGDVVNYGPWANECVQLLETLDNAVLLKGNHEQNFLNGFYNGKNIIARSFFEFCYPKFQEFNNIKKYKNNFHFCNIEVKHTINNQYFYPDTDIKELNIEKNYIIGHSHHQFLKKNNSFFFCNTGSLGQNRKYLNQACYTKYDTKKKIITLHSFVFDIDKVIRQMQNESYPEVCIDYYLSKEII